MARHEYGDVTTSEIQQAYAEYCADHGWNALPTAVVERTLPDIMLEEFHVTKCHCIERDGKKYIWCNFFPVPRKGQEDTFKDWKRQEITMHDGGFRYWQIEYDPKTGKCHNFNSNGYA